MEGHDFFEGLARCDGVDQEETLAGAHVLFSHSRVFFLAGCIQDVQQGDLIVDDTLLAVGIWVKQGSASSWRGTIELRPTWWDGVTMDRSNNGIVGAHLRLLDRTHRRSGSGSAGWSSRIYRRHRRRRRPACILVGTVEVEG